eukprot:8509659-Pyramimonas_sp.AAC.1
MEFPPVANPLPERGRCSLSLSLCPPTGEEDGKEGAKEGSPSTGPDRHPTHADNVGGFHDLWLLWLIRASNNHQWLVSQRKRRFGADLHQ